MTRADRFVVRQERLAVVAEAVLAIQLRAPRAGAASRRCSPVRAGCLDRAGEALGAVVRGCLGGANRRERDKAASRALSTAEFIIGPLSRGLRVSVERRTASSGHIGASAGWHRPGHGSMPCQHVLPSLVTRRTMASCADSASPPGRSRWRPACSSPSARSASRTRSPIFRPPTSLLVIVAFLAPTTVGLVIAIHQPRNRIAWILLLGALGRHSSCRSRSSSAGAGPWARRCPANPLAWPIAVAFVFPNGKLLSPRWRWVASAPQSAAAGSSRSHSSSRLRSRRRRAVESDRGRRGRGSARGRSRRGLAPAPARHARQPRRGAVAIRIRLQRSVGSSGCRRCGSRGLPRSSRSRFSLCISSGLLGRLGDTNADAGLAFLMLIDIAVAASVGIAVGRYRLYAIDRLVNRTLVYAVLTGPRLRLRGAYDRARRARRWARVNGHDDLVVAIGFLPLRRRIQDIVDRRFSCRATTASAA